MIRIQSIVAVGLSLLLPVVQMTAQQAAQQATPIGPTPPNAKAWLRPYLPPEIPAIRSANSPRLASFLRGSNLYLTARDALALALENNIDLEMARYNPITAEWRITRSLAGGALPGVPSGASQAASFASGQGVQGSQAAAGVSGGGGAGGGGGSTNATVSQVGPVTQTLDPAFQQATTFSHRSSPQANATQSVIDNLVSSQRAYSGSLQQGLLSGGSVTVSYSHHFLNENAPTDLLNPSVAATVSITVQHNLLQGYGTAVNGRNIKVAKLNRKISDIDFQTQVSSTVSAVLRAYYTLVADHEDVRAKQEAATTAEQFVRETRKRVEDGAQAELEILRAQSLSAASRRDLIVSRTSLDQHELQLKTLISRTGVSEPAFRNAHIVPLDKIVIPDKEDLPALSALSAKALATRPDIAAQAARLETSEVSAIGTRNGLLPTGLLFGVTSDAGLAGVQRKVPNGTGFQTADPYFAGGVGTALGQIFRRNYPTELGGGFFRASIGNNQAQADFGIDQLQLRQSQLTNAKSRKQVEVDVQNAVIAIGQARVRYEAAKQNRELAEELLRAEQKRLQLEASTPYNVVQQQRDLAIASSGEITALVAYKTARIALDRSLGTILEANGVTIAEAISGKVEAPPSPLP